MALLKTREEKMRDREEKQKNREIRAAEQKDNQMNMSLQRGDSLLSIYDKYLHDQDGYIHILMLNSLSEISNDRGFSVEKKYTTEIGGVVDAMQKKGYQILDIKYTIVENQKLREMYQTLITYK
ncbi:hypothetical protein M2475_002302 [Breznakia sp. PF5-3]|uniref:hypothetical protein n=1 Tax=unclassified Breznakia TaxID=2623764 RepID=UPI002406FB41|nr:MULTISPECIES: hypothetical protein [unclassified Breznakia]MDF9825922.1 hypothetical protein [Breznakia sp. PM6-1]MDF9836716.1 hypothetical protein [Breznakia sp. PF5-3]MDF9838984.1 hypothetical protein [Breznakia sp. PFB2-8]MDF9860998.1 hypothetical protein [Breznakia sp. PH5-24]